MKNVELTIDLVGARGDGLASYKGQTIYVARALAGERVRVRGKRGRDGVTRADIQEIIAPSADRQKPPCPHYDECGGCAFQHVTLEAYKAEKINQVKQALARKDVQPQQWKEPIFIPEATRRRASFSAFKQNGRVIIGYHKRRSKMIADIYECRVLRPTLMAMREKLKGPLAAILKDKIPTDIFLQEVGGAIEMLITGPVGQKKGAPDLPVLEAVAAMAEDLDIARIGWRLRERDRAEHLIQRKPIISKMGALSVELPFGAFLQPSAQGQAALVTSVMDALPEKERFADLFCGSGTFAGAMLERGSVDAYEMVGDATSRLDKAARGTKLSVHKRDLFDEPLAVSELNKFDAVVFDPPRAGAKDQVKDIAMSNVPLVIGVSCNPATFARDAHTLEEGGYTLASLQIVDQFIYSPHVEVVGVFRR